MAGGPAMMTSRTHDHVSSASDPTRRADHLLTCAGRRPRKAIRLVVLAVLLVLALVGAFVIQWRQADEDEAFLQYAHAKEEQRLEEKARVIESLESSRVNVPGTGVSFAVPRVSAFGGREPSSPTTQASSL